MRRTLRRVAIGTAGATLVLTGLALVVLPGPGLLVVAAGVGLLALEFDTAQRLRHELRQHTRSLRRRREREGD